MDTALAIVTMMEIVMVVAHPLPPQTIVFKFMPNANSIRVSFIYHAIMHGYPVSVYNTQVKNHTPKREYLSLSTPTSGRHMQMAAGLLMLTDK